MLANPVFPDFSLWKGDLLFHQGDKQENVMFHNSKSQQELSHSMYCDSHNYRCLI